MADRPCACGIAVAGTETVHGHETITHRAYPEECHTTPTEREAGEVAAVLADHAWVAGQGCLCGAAVSWVNHAGHQAAALAPLIAERERAAGARAWEEGAYAGRTHQQLLAQYASPTHIGRRAPDPIRNPYRAARAPEEPT